ncbi:MAG: DUF5916 domain-containing protein [Gemmatimonadaceae bacterium]
MSGQASASGDNVGRPSAQAARRQGIVAVDGRLDDAAWLAATPITSFVQQDPVESAPPSERTEIRILYDDDAVYLAARMYDRGVAGVHGVLTRRDQLINSASGETDKLIVSFDTYRNNVDETLFELNPRGVKGDAQNGDVTFDPVWEGVARTDSAGWTAELRLPLSQLHYPRTERQLWGMQIVRLIARRHERDMWAFWRKSEFGGSARFGLLEGIVTTSNGRRLEAMPYVTARGTFSRIAESDPFHSNGQARYRVGGDVKMNVTSNLTLDATINPDFGQVEVDPAVVNLSAFETTLLEKRPFFTSGSQFFALGAPPCMLCVLNPGAVAFYSRRVGRSPQLLGLVAPSAAYVDAPDATPIPAALKLTGRTRKGLAIGMLDAVTHEQSARFTRIGDPAVNAQEIEPGTNYFVARLRQDIHNGRYGVGGLATRADRQLTNPLERAWLRSSATYVRLDGDAHSADRTYNLNAAFGITQVDGDTAAIRRTQESSTHYFQRPDRRESSDRLFDARYDPSRTSLRGFIGLFRAGKDAGDWHLELANITVSPGTELNDVGLLLRADNAWTNATVHRVWTRPTRWYHQASILLGAEDQRDFEGNRLAGQLNIGADLTLPSYWTLDLRGFRRPTYDDPTLTRGGPVEERYGYSQGALTLTTDQRRPLAWTFRYGRGKSIDNTQGGGTAAFAGMTLKATPQATIGLSADFLRDATSQQYVMSLADSTAPSGFAGQRYVFGRIVQKTMSLALRVNAAFTPTLTLEMFAQPYVSSGAYSDFKEFAGARTKSMIHYGVDAGSSIMALPAQTDSAPRYSIDPDGAGPAPVFILTDPSFTYRSLRGTAVLRWEYRPGSTLYVVWTQQREARNAVGTFDLARDGAALLGDRPTNIVQLKATYWLGR